MRIHSTRDGRALAQTDEGTGNTIDDTARA